MTSPSPSGSPSISLDQAISNPSISVAYYYLLTTTSFLLAPSPLRWPGTSLVDVPRRRVGCGRAESESERPTLADHRHGDGKGEV